MLVTFSLSLEQFVSGFSQGTEFDGIRRFPDVDHYFSSQKNILRQSTPVLYLSSLLKVLTTTLLYVGLLMRMIL